MTTHEKARLIEFANEIYAEGERHRQMFRGEEIQFISGYHAGSGQKGKDIAERLVNLIDVLEIVNGVEVET